ncbi:cytochrome P450 [Apodospora peruviana]|uniref:Cytochrome P450 n=1 Tax=Apodospora peruviana TaxID=516989 RepID=A0AAE0HSU9_9PEZI|nr:cytochrome P450 [Apodospora peruviana]
MAFLHLGVMELTTASQGLQVLVLGAGVFIVITIFRYFLTWYRLRHVPGPFLNSLTTLIQLKKVFDGEYHLYLNGLAQKYGPLVRIGPNEVMFSDPDTLRRCSAVRYEYSRGPFFEALRASPNKDHVFSTRDENFHKELRGKMGPGYAGQENGGFERSLDKIIHALIDLIERKYISTDTEYRPIEFSDRASYFTLDVISEIAYGEPFGFLKNDQDMFGYLEQSHKALPFMIVLGTLPGLSNWKDMWPLSLLMPSEKDKFGMGYMLGFATKFIDKRLAPDAKPGRDIIQSFINHGLPRDQLVQEITLQILAGSDTTATAIRMTLLYLIATPPALRRLVREIDDAIAEGKISSDKIITTAQANALPFLQAVVREGLRIFPPATGLVGKEVPKGSGDTVHRYYLPPGTIVGQNIWGICRSKDIFGDDANQFRPERWLTNDEDNLRAMADAQELVFGYGKYQCLGKQLVRMELGKVFVELLRRYDFSVVEATKPVSLRNAATWVTKDLWLKITRRTAGGV